MAFRQIRYVGEIAHAPERILRAQAGVEIPIARRGVTAVDLVGTVEIEEAAVARACARRRRRGLRWPPKAQCESCCSRPAHRRARPAIVAKSRQDAAAPAGWRRRRRRGARRCFRTFRNWRRSAASARWVDSVRSKPHARRRRWRFRAPALGAAARAAKLRGLAHGCARRAGNKGADRMFRTSVSLCPSDQGRFLRRLMSNDAAAITARRCARRC